MIALAALVVAQVTAGDPRVDAALAHMKRAADAVVDVSCTFSRREYVDGELQPEESISLAWRKPGDLAMRWLDGKNAGRALVFRAGAREMSVKSGFLKLDLEPASFLAKRGERHTIREAGPVFVAHRILADVALSAGAARVQLTAQHDVGGAPATCWSASQPKDREPRLYAERAEICVDDKTGLPSLVRIWNREDGALRLVEDYRFTGLRANAGVGDAAFASSTYGF